MSLTHFSKNIPIFFCLLVLTLMAGCSKTPASELDIRGGLAYEKGTAKLFSGSVISYYPQNKDEKKTTKPRVYQKGSYNDGRKEGRWTTYKWNNEREEAFYEYNKRHGVTTWFYSKDRLKKEQRYANNMLHGEGTFYNIKGEIIKQVFYDRNRLIATPANRLDGIPKIRARKRDRGWLDMIVAGVNDFF